MDGDPGTSRARTRRRTLRDSKMAGQADGEGEGEAAGNRGIPEDPWACIIEVRMWGSLQNKVQPLFLHLELIFINWGPIT